VSYSFLFLYIKQTLIQGFVKKRSPNPDPITLATEKEQWCRN